ncbi:hypothetical protein [Campylobacter pinnipediorum]|uniref:hypothetical protein n=1 Tax=Campylobacter pinnipediorum TaxID=1965231 RepID=UPI0012947091|nr:hypothetical protein [Campylobacter pinnipediorum]
MGSVKSDIDTVCKIVGVFDRISEVAQKGVLFAIDEKASELYHAKKAWKSF